MKLTTALVRLADAIRDHRPARLDIADVRARNGAVDLDGYVLSASEARLLAANLIAAADTVQRTQSYHVRPVNFRMV